MASGLVGLDEAYIVVAAAVGGLLECHPGDGRETGACPSPLDIVVDIARAAACLIGRDKLAAFRGRNPSALLSRECAQLHAPPPAVPRIAPWSCFVA